MLSRFNLPKDDSRYSWTRHVVGKMQYYRLSESIIKRIIRAPKRVEKGVAENTIACMQPAGSKKKQEIWVMYQQKGERKHIITAWRYPGTSPVRDQIPIPPDILEELESLV
ncbi:MAG: hypothetical protein AAB725_01815 [Patescibacteria group bacterium]